MLVIISELLPIQEPESVIDIDIHSKKPSTYWRLYD